MRRYRFRLERLLAIRRHVERDWELRLARATGVVLGTTARIEAARQGVAASFDSPYDASWTGPRADLVAAAERYRQGMAARIQSFEQDLERQRADLEEVRVGYLEASRRRKVLDKLKERQAEAARRLAGRVEIATLNDIATSRAARWGEGGT
jgi:flagellar protein FliJ